MTAKPSGGGPVATRLSFLAVCLAVALLVTMGSDSEPSTTGPASSTSGPTPPGGSSHAARSSVATFPTRQAEGVVYGEVVHRDGYREVPVSFPSASDGVTLSGVIHLPADSGTYPASVFVHGSGRNPRLRYSQLWASGFVSRGFAVLSYDKRGVGESGGRCCPQIMPQLGGDAMAAAAAARGYLEIDPDRVGLTGVSQAGWIIPNAAARDPHIKFALIISGPTVSVGHENVYSDLTDERGCGAAGVSIAVAEEEISTMRPRGFDPAPDLHTMTQPGYWIFGLNDISVPINLSAAFLHELAADGKPLTVRMYPGANHGMGTAPCRGGPSAPGWIEPMFEWLQANVG